MPTHVKTMTNIDIKESSCVQDSEGVAEMFLVGSKAFPPSVSVLATSLQYCPGG